MNIEPKNLCQIEISVSDLKASAKYYEDVFGWKAVPAYIHNYIVLDVGDAGFGVSLVASKALEDGDFQQRNTLCFKVESEARALELTAYSSAFNQSKNDQKPKTLPGFGKVFNVYDPDGNKWGLFVDEDS